MSRLWILDLDNTLYPASSGLFPLIDRRIVEYMTDRLGLPTDQVSPLRASYRRDYGLTLVGLMNHYGVDPDEYSRFVHDVPLADFLGPDPVLDQVLQGLPGEKVIFTNGSAAHAEAVLGLLGVAAHLSAIYDLAFMDYVPKPKPHGYRKLLGTLGVPAAECCAVDDMADNLDTALALGMETVLVGPEARPPHRHVRDARDLRSLE